MACLEDDLVTFAGASKEAYNSDNLLLLVLLQQERRLTSYKIKAQSLLH